MNEAVLEQKPFALFLEKLLCLAGRFLRLIPSNACMRVPVGINRGLRWVRGSANAPEWLGIYEYRKQRVLRGIVARGASVCDIGANAGFYTLGMSRLVGPHGCVIAFEPLLANLTKIRCHLAINKIHNVTLSECALSDKRGPVTFDVGENDFTGRIFASGPKTIEVPAVSLDEFIAQNATADPTFLKIDVEGAEACVLAGARELIKRTHPTMLIALHGTRAASDCYSILRQSGYIVRALNGSEIKNAQAIPPEILAVYGEPTQLAVDQVMSADG